MDRCMYGAPPCTRPSRELCACACPCGRACSRRSCQYTAYTTVQVSHLNVEALDSGISTVLAELDTAAELLGLDEDILQLEVSVLALHCHVSEPANETNETQERDVRR